MEDDCINMEDDPKKTVSIREMKEFIWKMTAAVWKVTRRRHSRYGRREYRYGRCQYRYLVTLVPCICAAPTLVFVLHGYIVVSLGFRRGVIRVS